MISCSGSVLVVGHRGPRLRGDPGAQLLELGDAQGQVLPALAREARAAPRQRAIQLDGGMCEASLVEVEARAQRQVLAQQRRASRGEQLGEALFGTQRRRATRAQAPPPAGAGPGIPVKRSSRACSQRP